MYLVSLSHHFRCTENFLKPPLISLKTRFSSAEFHALSGEHNDFVEVTSSCYRSCQFGGCAPKTPGGARARFQVRWMGAAPPPQTPALPRSGTRTGGARAKLGCGFSLRRHLFLSPSLHLSLSLSSLLLRGTSTDCTVYARGLRRLLAHELSFNHILSIFVFSFPRFLSNFCLTLSRTANELL